MCMKAFVLYTQMTVCVCDKMPAIQEDLTRAIYAYVYPLYMTHKRRKWLRCNCSHATFYICTYVFRIEQDISNNNNIWIHMNIQKTIKI